MKLLTVKEAAKNWNVSERRVQQLCNQGKIKGAERFGKSWMIPEQAVFPKKENEQNLTLPMPKKTPFLDMTNIYNEAGKADECGEMLVNNPEAYTLYKAQILYRRGEIDKVYDMARYFLRAHSGFYAILGGGMLLAQCAIWRGDLHLWNEAKKHICEAPCKTKEEREIISLAIAIADSSIYDNKDYPEWFKKGSFNVLPGDSHPSAKVFYIKYLYMGAFAIATKQLKIEGVDGLALMKMIPFTIEPFISQAIIDKTIIPEIYLRLSCAVAYHNSGQKDAAIEHLDIAIKLALKDGLFGILTEYVRHFGGLLEERIALVNPTAVIVVAQLYQRYSVGWAKISGAIRNKYIVTSLTPREHEIAKLLSFGLTLKEIGGILYISESSARQAMIRAMNKAGIEDKSEFIYII